MKSYLAPAAVLMGIATAGCSPADGEGRSLRSANIPADFTFQASKGLTVAVNAQDNLFGDQDQAQLIVSRSNGTVLFRGSIRKGEVTDLQLLAPRAEQALTVVVAGRGGEARATLSPDRNGRFVGKVQ